MDFEEWESLEEALALFSAQSVDEFHQRLVLLPPDKRNAADSFEPTCLFQHYHRDDDQRAATTAFLLVTDRRWRNATGRIMTEIAGTGLIGEDHLDLLAHTFLAAGRCLYWQPPKEWFGDAIEIELDTDLPGSAAEDLTTTPADDDQPVVIAREVRPPLRRWAAAHLVDRSPSNWSPILSRARELDARNAAAVMRGILDSISSLSEPAQSYVRGLAAEWPDRGVRTAATPPAEQPEPVDGQTRSVRSSDRKEWQETLF
jgi:hypothetical protein